MFERFTDRARRVLVLAQDEARLLGHSFIGTEHLLLGLIHEGRGVAAKALGSLGITLDAARDKVEETRARGPVVGSPPFTSRAKKVLELSLRAALEHQHNYIGTEHLLLGLVREGEGHGARVLVLLGADLDRVHETVLRLLSPSGPEAPVPRRRAVAQRFVPPGGQQMASCSFCGRDLWEVDRYVSAGRSVICAECVSTASDMLREEPAVGEREIFFPARVLGDVPDDDAVGAITECFRMVFGGGAGDPERFTGFLEDDEELRPSFEAAGQRTMTRASGSRVARLRFVTPDLADVRFEIVLEGGAAFPFEGQAVRRGGRWLVSRATAATVLGRAGIQLPPDR